MTTETMTLTQALSELKILDKRISYEITSGVFCGCKKHVDAKFQGVSIEDAKKNMRAAYDKTTNLIARRTAIKKALTQANATTEVTVAGKTMTIAEAIFMKSGIDMQKLFLKSMATQYENNVRTADNFNGIKLTEACDRYIGSLYGNEASSENRAAEIDDVRTRFIENQTMEVFSGFPIKEVIENMKDEIDSFEANVDSAITIANSTKTITIEY